MALKPQREIQDGRVGTGTGSDSALRLPGQGANPVPIAIRQWLGICYTALVKSYGLQQEFITPYSPEQNGMVERVIRTLKDQCVHRHRFETLQHASRVIGDWIGFYNHQRPQQALGMRTPTEVYALAA